MARAQTKFIVGLSVLITLIVCSMLRQQQVTVYAVATIISVTVAALVFDYLKVNQFLTVLRAKTVTECSHDRAIEAALAVTLKSPILMKLIGTELRTLYYAFFAKLAGNIASSENRLFSYGKSSNAHDVFLFVALSQLPFLPFVHLLLEHAKGPGPAWAVSLLTLWSVVWYLAQVEAARLRPIELGGEHLKYRFGLCWAADIPLKKITSARSIAATEELNDSDLFLSPMGSTRNVILEFESRVQFAGPYLFKQHRKRAAISLDNPAHFLSELAHAGVSTQ